MNFMFEGRELFFGRFRKMVQIVWNLKPLNREMNEHGPIRVNELLFFATTVCGCFLGDY
jgi:hypothetical protein